MLNNIEVIIKNVKFDIGPPGFCENVFNDFSGSIKLDKSQLSVMLGQNGVGKSILAQLIAGNIRPRNGLIEFYDKERALLSSVRPLYIPQNFEQAAERYAIDLYASIAARHSHYFNRSRFEQIIKSNINKQSLYSCCKNLSRCELITGIMHSLCYGKPDLVILDEPFAQLNDTASAEILSLMREVLKSSFVLIITHPSQTPPYESLLQYKLCVNTTGKKIITEANQTDHTKRNKGELPSKKLFSVKFASINNNSSDTKQNSEFFVFDKHINNIIVPDGLSPGRFAAMLVRSLKLKTDVRVDSHSLSIDPQPVETKKVAFLPASAQTSIILQDKPLYFSSLYDRWNTVQTTGFLVLDKADLRDIFQKGSERLPITPENGNVLGSHLSGGNRQLLALRTVLDEDKDIFVLVTPYAGLDDTNYRKVLHRLLYLSSLGKVVITIDSCYLEP